MEDKILIIVPAFNEEKNISLVIEEIRTILPTSDILVVNDCSTDNTSKTAKESEYAKVVDLPFNLGIGGAVQVGFKYALRNGYDYVVQVDGDGQHLASEVIKLMHTMRKLDLDMIIGSRFLDVESFRTTAARRFGIKYFYIIFRLLINQGITDGTSGFRAYNCRCIKFLSDNYPDDYPEPEAVVMLKKNGFKVGEVGVGMRERRHGKSSITPFKSLYYMIKVSISILFSYLRNQQIIYI